LLAKKNYSSMCKSVWIKTLARTLLYVLLILLAVVKAAFLKRKKRISNYITVDIYIYTVVCAYICG
jgi:hypothetical protein